MTPFMIAFFMSAGVSAWTYNKVQERTGNNTESSIKVTAIVAVFVFIITLTVLSTVGSYIGK
jgi:hypothetical protein